METEELRTCIFLSDEENLEEFIESEFYYFIVDETDTHFLIVCPSKYDRFMRWKGQRNEYLYSEWIDKSEMLIIEV